MATRIVTLDITIEQVLDKVRTITRLEGESFTESTTLKNFQEICGSQSNELVILAVEKATKLIHENFSSPVKVEPIETLKISAPNTWPVNYLVELRVTVPACFGVGKIRF